MHLRDLKEAPQLFKATFTSLVESKAPRLGAALAFYTIFAIAPLFIIVMWVAGFFFGERAARHELFGQLDTLVGQNGVEAIRSLVAAADRPKAGFWAALAACGTLVAGATAVFVELQDALNTVWGVHRKAGPGLRKFIKNRALSFAMVLCIGFLLLVSLTLNTALEIFSQVASGAFPMEHFVWRVINFLLSLGVITLLFAMIFKVLPDVKLAWRNVWIGALVTALLFNIGKWLLGMYLGRSSFVSVYGAAGSFVVLLLWVYYSAQIVLFGAEFTRIYSERKNPPKPVEKKPRLPAGPALRP